MYRRGNAETQQRQQHGKLTFRLPLLSSFNNAVYQPYQHYLPKILKSSSFSFEKTAARAGGIITAAAESSPPRNTAASAAIMAAVPASFCIRRPLSARKAARFVLFRELTVILLSVFSLFSRSMILAFEVVMLIFLSVLSCVFLYFSLFFFWLHTQMFCTFVLIYIIEHRFFFVKSFWKICSRNFIQK